VDEGLAKLAVASSLERIVDYIMNIGELTINLACSSKPEVSIESKIILKIIFKLRTSCPGFLRDAFLFPASGSPQI